MADGAPNIAISTVDIAATSFDQINITNVATSAATSVDTSDDCTAVHGNVSYRQRNVSSFMLMRRFKENEKKIILRYTSEHS